MSRPEERAAAKSPQRRKPRAPRLIDVVTAILLISSDPKRLFDFYRAVLGLPLEREVHDGMPLHYG